MATVTTAAADPTIVRSRHSAPSPVSLARSSSSSSTHSVSAASPVLSSVAPQSPLPLPRVLSGSSRSPALNSRRVSLVSLGPLVGPCSAPGTPMVPQSPSGGGRTQVPTVRDLRSSHYQTLVCGQHSNLVQVLRAAMQGMAAVTPEGKVEIAATMPPPAPSVAPGTVPPSPPSAKHSVNSSASSRRVFVGLCVGPSHGRAYWEGKLAWPVDDPASSGAAASAAASQQPTSVPASDSTPNTPRGVINILSSEALANRHLAFQQLLRNLVSHLPPLPVSLIGPPREQTFSLLHSSTDSPCSTPSSASASASSFSGSDATPVSARLSRRPSMSGDSDTWSEGEVVLSVFLLLDNIDVDSKQITFVAPCAAHGRAWDHQALFAALYKADLSAPASTAVTNGDKAPGAQA